MDGFNDTSVVHIVTKEEEKNLQPLPSWKAFTCYSVPYDCIISKVLVKEGSQVEKGQDLFVLERVKSKSGSLDDDNDDVLLNAMLKVYPTAKSSVTVTAHKGFLVDAVHVFEGLEYEKYCPLLAFKSTETNATEMGRTSPFITHSMPCSELKMCNKNVTKEDEEVVSLDDDHDDALVNKKWKVSSFDDDHNDALVNKKRKLLTPWKAVTIFCVPYDFIVTKILVKEGTEVEKGQGLFVLEPVEIKVSFYKDDHDDALVNKKRKGKRVTEVVHSGQPLITVVAHKAFLVSKVLIYEGVENEKLLPLLSFETIEKEEDTGKEDPSNMTSSLSCSALRVWDRNVTEMWGEEFLCMLEEQEGFTESLSAGDRHQ